MKRATIALLTLLLPIAALAQEGFTVRFRLEGLGENRIRVFIQRNGKTRLDTLMPASPDIVIWKGVTPEPQIVRIDVLDTTQYLYVGRALSMPPQLSFMLTNSEIEIRGTSREAYAASVTGIDPDVTAYEQFHRMDIPLSRESWAIQQELNRKMVARDTAGTASMKDRVNQLRKRNQALRSEYIDQHPNAFASLCMLQSMGLLFTPEQMMSKFNSLDTRLKSSGTGLAVLERIESNRNTGNGKPVIPIRQVGLDGQVVDVNEMLGKVVLIDFWGSWCVPCRQSHPAMKELYATYKDRGFEIIGIANEIAGGPKPMEVQLEKWRKAVADDGIHWKHVLYDPAIADLVKQYDIGGYPTKFLIGRDGRFILKILGNSPQGHEQLKRKLEELLPAR